MKMLSRMTLSRWVFLVALFIGSCGLFGVVRGISPTCPRRFPGSQATSTKKRYFGSDCDFGEICCNTIDKNDAGECVENTSCGPEFFCFCDANPDGNSCTWQCVTPSCFPGEPECFASCPDEFPGVQATSTNNNFFGSDCDFGELCCNTFAKNDAGECIENTSCGPEFFCVCDANAVGDSCTWQCATPSCFLGDPECFSP
jgi:hypothetical protein